MVYIRFHRCRILKSVSWTILFAVVRVKEDLLRFTQDFSISISIEYTPSNFTDHMIRLVVRYWKVAANTTTSISSKEKWRWKKSVVCKSLLLFTSSPRNVCVCVSIHLVCCLLFFHDSLLQTVSVEFGFIKFIAALQEIDTAYIIDFHQNTHTTAAAAAAAAPSRKWMKEV